MERNLGLSRDIHVVYASDDKFAEILGISLVSLYENNIDMEEVTVYVLDSGITDENKKKIELISQTYNRKRVQWITAKDIGPELQMEISSDRGSLSQYARLFISSLLPGYLKRVLYLDCDTIIEKSLEELWNIDLNGKTAATLMDAFSKYYRKNIDLQPEDIMFNSGVMLIDLDRWKKLRIENKLLDFIKKKRGHVQQGDQGALNAILSHDVYCFDPKFNAVTIFCDFSYKEMLIYRKPPNYYTEGQIESAVKKPVIIHFTTSFLSLRPWIEGSEHHFREEWLCYKKKSPWKDDPSWKLTNKDLGRKLLISIGKIVPRGITIRVYGVLQAYIRPVVNRIKLR